MNILTIKKNDLSALIKKAEEQNLQDIKIITNVETLKLIEANDYIVRKKCGEWYDEPYYMNYPVEIDRKLFGLGSVKILGYKKYDATRITIYKDGSYKISDNIVETTPVYIEEV